MLPFARLLLRHDRIVAAALACFVAGAAFFWNTRIGAGADSYGYVSQADLWRSGSLYVRQSFAGAVPWPGARWTFAPLGYRPEPDGYDIVPVYAPGLPILMAGAKTIAGQCGVIAVVPLSAGVLVWSTYLIGRRIDRRLVGLAAAWLIATSTTILYSMMSPMSDVPAAAAWAVAVVALLTDSRLGAAVGGLAAAVAILIRPNLAPMAAALIIWTGWRDVSVHSWRRARFVIVLAPIGLAVIFVGILNDRLYGSPTTSGYSELSRAFSISHVWPNLKTYSRWLASAETPLAIGGIASLFLPFWQLWRSPVARRGAVLLAAVVALVWAAYLPYSEWDAWWYLRFLLPSWSMMAIGTATLAAVLWRMRTRWLRVAVVLVLAGVGLSGVARAAFRDAFRLAQGEWKYIETARAVAAATPADAVIYSIQHSGSLRHYAGRLTIRWDQMELDWLDRSVDWINARGHHPYLLVEDWEAERLRKNFGAANAVARLDWRPILTLRGGAIRLYDAVDRTNQSPPTELPETPRSLACPPPIPMRPFDWR